MKVLGGGQVKGNQQKKQGRRRQSNEGCPGSGVD